MEMKLTRVITFILHPLLMPVYILALLLEMNNYSGMTIPLYYKLLLTGVVMLMTVILPLIFTWFLRRLEFIRSFYMPTKEERVYPILSVVVFYYATFYLLRDVSISGIFSYYMLGATLVTVVVLIINFYRLISLHATGIGSIAGLFLGLMLNFRINFLPEIIAAVMLAGIIGYARIKQGAHQPSEIYSGFVIGATVLTILISLI